MSETRQSAADVIGSFAADLEACYQDELRLVRLTGFQHGSLHKLCERADLLAASTQALEAQRDDLLQALRRVRVSLLTDTVPLNWSRALLGDIEEVLAGVEGRSRETPQEPPT